MELTDDLFMFLLHNRNILEGDIIYYVVSQDDTYVILKTRIKEKNARSKKVLSNFETYSYLCEDGYRFDAFRLTLPIFETMAQAVEYVVGQLQNDINRAEVSLRNAQEHLNRLHRSLKVYQKYQQINETE